VHQNWRQEGEGNKRGLERAKGHNEDKCRYNWNELIHGMTYPGYSNMAPVGVSFQCGYRRLNMSWFQGLAAATGDLEIHSNNHLPPRNTQFAVRPTSYRLQQLGETLIERATVKIPKVRCNALRSKTICTPSKILKLKQPNCGHPNIETIFGCIYIRDLPTLPIQHAPHAPAGTASFFRPSLHLLGRASHRRGNTASWVCLTRSELGVSAVCFKRANK
jgi:hypothetical protein